MTEPRTLVSVIIPAYNEESTIAEILRRVSSAPLPDGMDLEMVVVDDASQDATGDLLRRFQRQGTYDLRLVKHDRNRGKGAAVRSGLAAATGEVLLIQDADLEYHPGEYPKLLQPILDGEADVVYGSRFLGGPQRVVFFWHYVGNRFLTLLSNMFTNLNLSDMETGYKVFRRQMLDGVELRSNRFGIEPELTAKMARRNARIYQVPISYFGRTYSEGKKIGWKDGFAAIWFILRYNLFD